ncbi:MAG TPA: alkaline phosphatase family protein [Bryobacteraceae bacterium]
MKLLATGAAALAGLVMMQSPVSQQSAREKVGPLPDGGFLLNSGWTIRPAGQQVHVSTLPMSAALSTNGKFLLVMNAGYDPPTISVIDVAQKKEIGRTPLPDCWLGLVAGPGDLVYAGGGTTGKVFELSLNPETGALTRAREFDAVRNTAEKGKSFIGDVELSPDAHLLYAADLSGDSIAVINLRTGRLTDRWKTGRRPYRIVVTPDGRQLIISSWADAAIYQHAAASGTLVTKTRVAPHPTDMLWINKPAPTEEGASSYVARLFVTASNTNNAYSFGVTKDGALDMLETINVSLTPMHPLGMTPSALATNDRGNRLFIVCSDANAVLEADISSPRSRVTGFIPTGWYPTAVRSLPGNELVVLNGKGLGSQPNPQGPNPTRRAAPLHEGGNAPAAVQYVGHIQTGTAAFLPEPGNDELHAFTQTVVRNSPYKDEMIYGPVLDQQQAYFSRSQGRNSPIQHVIYMIKENRTYDQVLGDLEKGNGDKSLVLFGEKVTPNLHRLARDFVLYDNFYENADVSAEGHNWASAAIAPDYTVKVWPNTYGHRGHPYDFEGGEPANTPPAGYIWDNALQAGIAIRDYGQWTTNIPLKNVNSPRQIATVKDRALVPYVDMNYRGFDLEYSDLDRAKEFIREWKEFDAKGTAPQLSIVRLGNDHTQGVKAGTLTPISYVAQNDYAVGMVVDAVSHSKFWSSTALFIIEDDAQNGPDHVDSHRAPAWVVSPFTQRATVDSSMYNQASVLRTIELITGLRPMTQFDAAAPPMFASFSRTPNVQPYTVIEPKVSLTERNPENGAGAAASARMDFSEADRIDDDDLNAILWRAIRHSNPPPPTRSGFAR